MQLILSSYLSSKAFLGVGVYQSGKIEYLKIKMSSSEGDKQQRIFLWIVPRTCSTVLSKCMTFVDGVQVWMEPYLACKLNDTIFNPCYGKDSVGVKFIRDKIKEVEKTDEFIALRRKWRETIDKSPGIIDQDEISWTWVKEQLEQPEPGKKFIFIKDQSNVIFDHLEFLPDVPSRHTFLIRHPREVISSFREVIRDQLQMSNTECDQYKFSELTSFLNPKDFFPVHYKLWKHLCENSKEKPIVIDADDLLSKPDVILTKYFENLGIPFKENYLHFGEDVNVNLKWKGSSQYVLIEATTIVYSRAVKSASFEKPQRERGTLSNTEWPLTSELLEYINSALPYYEEMYQRRLH